MKTNIKKYLLNLNKDKILNKTIMILGATGSIGSSLLENLTFLGVKNIIIVGRNLEALNKLKEKYSLKFDVIKCDFSNKLDIDNLIKNLIDLNLKVDILINAIGIYHLNKSKIDNYDNTFYINTLMTIYLMNKMLDLNEDIKIINTGSISYHFTHIDFNDIDYSKSNNKTKIYSNSKRIMMEYSLFLINKNKNIILAHPGISCTNLFNKKNKAYNSLFYIFIVPLMKLLFMSPLFASLSLLDSIFIERIKKGYWIGPSILGIYGYPKIYKLNKDMLNEEIINKVYHSINQIIYKKVLIEN